MMDQAMMLFLLLALTAVVTPVVAQVNHAEAQIDWVLSHEGGFFSPKLKFQPINETDPKSTMGVFATENIQKDEILMVIPSACFLMSEGTGDECGTARNLMKERELKSKSKYAPYLDYVFDARHQGQVPSEWSSAGKKLIQTIIGRELPPFDDGFLWKTFQEECGGSGDPSEEEAWRAVIRRNTDGVLIPLEDMLNHRNGHWTNVKSTSVHNAMNITVFAVRDIAAGEQLYTSYNEPDYGLVYGLPHLFNDFGFVEQYPRRWLFEDVQDKDEDLVFELDEDPDTKVLHLKWLSEEPSERFIHFLRGHLMRLQNLGDFVEEQSQQLESSYERDTSIEYYGALMTALKHAILASEDGQEISNEFDELNSVSDKMKFTTAICDHGHARRDMHSDHYMMLDQSESFYQTIDFMHSKEFSDTCLYLEVEYGVHTCTSFRPHYHEMFIHYPARFLDEVRRVVFIGGGDNMVVHEVLKYPDLEFVLGLELDQTNARSSFKNMGTQPHFDDERVEWWFGDGAKSLLQLPKDYYGSFDLVLLDLADDVTEKVKVGGEYSLTDAAMQLLKPGGIAVRNEDWNFGTFDPFTDYSVDIYYVDLPITCYQGITMGSNDIDFLKKTPKDHRIDTVYLKPVDEMDHFDVWYNYRMSTNRTNTLYKKPEKAMPGGGVLMIIEAEASSVPLESPSVVRSLMSEALSNAGLTETSFQVGSKNDGYELVFILQEGYAVARVWQKLNYCAFDLMLWSKTETSKTAKAQLTAAVGSKSVSAYRITTSGMLGIDRENETYPLFAVANSACIDVEMATAVQDLVAPDQSTIDAVLSKSAAFIDSSAVLVLCGDPSSMCKSLDVLVNKDQKVVPLWTCPSLDTDKSREEMTLCKVDTLRALINEKTRFKGIVIDSQTPRIMGQIFQNLFAIPRVRRQFLEANHVIVFASEGNDAQWRRALLDRFRTNPSSYDPSYRAEVTFDGTDLELGIFWTQGDGFYSQLVDVMTSIEAETGLTANVKHVRNAANNKYYADFEPSYYASHKDYNYTKALEQYKSQQCLAKQTLSQYESKSDSFNATALQKALHATFLKMTTANDDEEIELFQSVGDGCIIVMIWSFGRIVLTWDGKQKVNLNIMTGENDVDHEKAANLFASKSKSTLMAYDEMPRGIGRVVNFASDYESVKKPHWAEFVQ